MDKQVIVQVKPNKSFFKQFNPQQHTLKAEGLDVNKEENYSHVGAFKLDAFLGTSRPLTPQFNITTNKWGFKGDAVTLKELVSQIQMRYEKGEKRGQIIKPEEVDIHNRYDPFFDHSEMMVKLENGKAKLNLTNPKDKFLYLCLSDDPNITNSKVGNPFLTKHQKFELLDINEEKAKIADNLDERIEAYTLFKNIKNNQDRLFSVARALDIIKDSKPEDTTALIIELDTRWVQNMGLYPNSSKTYQQVFIETAEKDTESLNRMYLVNFGVWKSIVRPRTYDGFWTMKLRDGSVKDLNGVKNKADAYRYFEDEANFPDLENLMHLTNAFNTNG